MTDDGDRIISASPSRTSVTDDNLDQHAGVAQLVEHNLAKVGVASSSLVSRSQKKASSADGAFFVSGAVENARAGNIWRLAQFHQRA